MVDTGLRGLRKGVGMRRILVLAAGVTAAAIVAVGVGSAATALTVGSGWQQFNWVGQTQPVVPSQTPFTFTTTSKVTLSITDVGCPGEVFTVYDNGILARPYYGAYADQL